jgi:hypothetical protein
MPKAAIEQTKKTKKAAKPADAAILDLTAKLEAANRAGQTLARCFQWDREEYQSNPDLVRDVRTDPVARKWLAELRKPKK